MCQEEDYTPSGDKEAFLTKSTKSVLSVLSKLTYCATSNKLCENL